MRIRVGALGLGTIAALSLGVADVAGAQPVVHVGPNQYFTASVNGSNGYPQPVVIRMACFGPISLGQTGHPMAGQTVEVSLAGPNTTHTGFTGPSATSIGAFFGPPPPLVSAGGGDVNFTDYGVAKPIPTSLNLPCGGRGQVTFVPLPMSPPTSRPAVVPVYYVGQP
jgi:hypothetical protein